MAGPDLPDLPSDLRAKRLEHLRALLVDAEPKVRAAAAAAIDRIEQLEDVAVLRERLASPEVLTRLNAVYGLGAARDPGALPALVSALRDETEDIRAAVLRTLGERRDPDALAPLLECLDDPSLLVRRHAVEALARFEDARLVPYLKSLLTDDDLEIRCEALRGLGRTHDARVESELLGHLADAEPRIRAAAAEALGEL